MMELALVRSASAARRSGPMMTHHSRGAVTNVSRQASTTAVIAPPAPRPNRIGRRNITMTSAMKMISSTADRTPRGGEDESVGDRRFIRTYA